MYRTPQRLSRSLLTLAALPLAALAHDYSFIEGGYVSIDNGAEDEGGIRIGGWIPLAPQFNLIAEYADADEFNQLSFGGQFHAPLSPQLDWTAGATMESIEVGRADDTGLGLRGGLRWQSTSGQFEVNPEIRFVDVFEDESTSLRVAGLAAINAQLWLQGAVQTGDDDRMELGIRHGF